MKTANRFVKRSVAALLWPILFPLSAICATWEPTINGHIYTGEQDRLIILIETRDQPFQTPDANAIFTRQFNEPGYSEQGCVGSVRDFMIDNSGGKFRPNFHILGPVMLPELMWTDVAGEFSYVTDYGRMVAHAVVYAKQMYPEIDFSIFDNRKTGVLDPVMVYHPGATSDKSPWPVASGIDGSGWTVNGFNVPGLEIGGGYALSPERAPDGKMAGYSLFLHEFGHTLGLPDDYSGRLGKFSVYCDGTFDGGIVPVNYNAGERLILGWLDYDVIDTDGEYTLESFSKNKALMLKTDNPDEYFLFSNRDNSGMDTPWDSYFEYGGMLVWHIDRSQTRVYWDNGNKWSTAIGMWHGNQPNGSPDHPCHKLIDADGRNQPYAANYRGGMYFPGPTNVTRLNSTTHPHFRSWDGFPLGVDIYDIRKEANNDITFKVKFSGNAVVQVGVKDENGKVITNAYIGLSMSDAAGIKIEADSGLTGIHTFNDITPGLYDITVDKEGYIVHTGTMEVLAGSNTCNVILEPADGSISVESIEFDREEFHIMVGASSYLRPEVLPYDAGNRTLFWDSSDPAVAMVNEDGTVKGISPGKATVTASLAQNSQLSASYTANVSLGQENIRITSYQRDAKITWPGFNPDYTWKVSWRIQGTSDYITAPDQTPVSLYIHDLVPDAEYEGRVEAVGNSTIQTVDFAFATSAETFDFPIIHLSQNSYSVGETIPLVAHNIGTSNYSVQWKVNDTAVTDGEFLCLEPGPCELRAEITFEDKTTEILIKELDIKR